MVFNGFKKHLEHVLGNDKNIIFKKYHNDILINIYNKDRVLDGELTQRDIH